MHAMAPVSNGDLQAGHSVGLAGGGAGVGTDGVGGRTELAGGAAGRAAGARTAAGAAAPTGSRAGAPTRNAWWHFGHCTFLPAASSGTLIGVPHVAFGQRIS